MVFAETEEREVMNCPIQEQTADGSTCGRCWHHLPDGITCPRHGEVAAEVERYNQTKLSTLENVMRKRKGPKLLGREFD